MPRYKLKQKFKPQKKTKQKFKSQTQPKPKLNATTKPQAKVRSMYAGTYVWMYICLSVGLMYVYAGVIECVNVNMYMPVCLGVHGSCAYWKFDLLQSCIYNNTRKARSWMKRTSSNVIFAPPLKSHLKRPHNPFAEVIKLGSPTSSLQVRQRSTPLSLIEPGIGQSFLASKSFGTTPTWDFRSTCAEMPMASRCLGTGPFPLVAVEHGFDQRAGLPKLNGGWDRPQGTKIRTHQTKLPRNKSFPMCLWLKTEDAVIPIDLVTL